MEIFQVSDDGINWIFWEGVYKNRLLYSYPFVREIKVEIIKTIKENHKFV